MDSAVRTGAVQDLRESQFARLTVATVGQPATTEIGELWISYEIELLKPRLGIPAAVSSVLLTDSSGGEAGGIAFNALVPSTNYQTVSVANRSVFGAYTSGLNAAGTTSIITFTDPRLSGRCGNFFLELDYVTACTGACAVSQVVGGNTTVVNSVAIGSNSTQIMALTCMKFNVGPGPWIVACIGPATQGAGQVCRLLAALTDHA